jgi:hypothetical protein
MIKSQLTFIFVFFALLPVPAMGQNDTALDTLRDHLSIRQSLKDKNTLNEPAFLTVSLPDEGPSVKVVALAATLLLKPESANPRFNVGAAVQFNSNSATDSRQNVFVGATELEARFGTNDSEETFLFPRLRAVTGYKRNGEKHTRSFAASAYVTYEKNRPETDSSSIPIGNGVIEFTPQTGLEFENSVAATNPGDEGRITRGLVATKINAYPVRRFTERLVLSADLAYRYDLQTDFTGSDRAHPFAQLSLAVTLDPFKVFSVSIDRVMGEDPTQDFVGPDFTRFAFKVELTKTQKRTIRRLRAAAGRHII